MQILKCKVCKTKVRGRNDFRDEIRTKGQANSF